MRSRRSPRRQRWRGRCRAACDDRRTRSFDLRRQPPALCRRRHRPGGERAHCAFLVGRTRARIRAPSPQPIWRTRLVVRRLIEQAVGAGAAGGRRAGGMSRIGKIRNGGFLSYRCAPPRRAAPAAVAHEVHVHGAYLGGVVRPGHQKAIELHFESPRAACAPRAWRSAPPAARRRYAVQHHPLSRPDRRSAPVSSRLTPLDVQRLTRLAP